MVFVNQTALHVVSSCIYSVNYVHSLFFWFFRVTCPETYFVEELLYADEASLENCKDLELVVFTLEPGTKEIKEHTAALEKENKVSKALDVENNENKVAKVRDHKQSKDAFESLLPSGKSTALENNFILDIDMDFFSTQNPFKLLYTDVSNNS